MVHFSTYAAVAATVAGVRAVNQAPPVPQNAQIGKLNFDVTCQLLNTLNYTFNAVFSGTAPVVYGSGQEIYFTDTVGEITIPEAIISLASVVSAKNVQAAINLQVNLSNASPEVLTAYNDTISNITLPASGDAIIRVPQGDGVVPPIGPITLGEANISHRIFLGLVTVELQLQDANYNNIGDPIAVTCGQQDVEFVLASINVDDSTGPPFAPANGFAPEFPDTPDLYETGSFRFPYACDFGSLGPQSVDLVIGGTIFTYFNPGQEFNLTQSQAFLYAPSSLITLASQSFPNATTLDLDVSEFEVKWDNASPASFNVAGSAGLSTSVKITGVADNADFNIPIPTDGFLTVGPFTAGDDGTFAAILVGHSAFKASLKDDSGKELFSFSGTCDPTSPLELIAIPITTASVPHYVYGINTGSGPPTSSAANSLPSLF